MSSALPIAATQPRRSLSRFIVDRNPFFLASAVLMFAGVRVILSALNVSPGDLPRLLLLIFALNVYEIAVIGLALFLILRRGQTRDGWILLSIEALFLVDLTDLNAELFTASLRLGILINMLCWLLAVGKITFVLRALKLRLATPDFAYAALQLAGVYFMAGIFKQVAQRSHVPGTLSPLAIYGAWWLVGGMLVLATLIFKKPNATAAESSLARLPGRLYLFLPFFALLVHLCGANRVYAIGFHPANLAPLLLGSAVLLTRWRGGMGRGFLIGSQAFLAGLAVLLSMDFPMDLMIYAGSHALSPLRLALMGSGGVLACGFFQSWQLLAAQIAAASLAMAWLGNTPGEMQFRIQALARAIYATLKRLIPETQMQWGIVAVAGSFIMLALGAAISLRKHPPVVAMRTEE